MRRRALLAACWVALFAAAAAAADTGTPAELVERSGVAGGLIVHVGCGDGRVTAALRVNERYVVQGLDGDASNVAAARERFVQRGLSGPVTAKVWDGPRLPYAENLVNLLVVGAGAKVADAEALRVLRPDGVLLRRTADGWAKTAKPRPAEIDDWTHYLHGPDNNAVAADTAVQPPRSLQWVAGPKWGRSHDHLSSVSAVVSANGRMFAIVDEGPTASVKAASKWRLVARDAFNGVLLWKRAIEPWEHQLRPFRSGPAEMPRRLVAVGDRVFVTPGYGKPVLALDAATGAELRSYAGTANAHEILHSDGRLYVVVSEPLEADSPTTGRIVRRMDVWRGFYQEYATRYEPKHLVAIDAATGKRLWEKDDADVAGILPLTLTLDDGRLFFQNAGRLIALDAAAGSELWNVQRPGPRGRYAWLTPTVVAVDGVVLSADRAAEKPVDTGRGKDAGEAEPVEYRVSANHILTEGRLIAFSAETGKRLWDAPCHEGFNAPADVLVIGGRLYSGILAWGRQPGITKIYDLHTGEVVATKKPDQKLYTLGFGHHRCHRNRATTRYIIQGRAGIEFIDVRDPDRVDVSHWVRGACQYGTLPCNGLMYAPTHPCACYVAAKLSGFNALSGERPETGQPVEELTVKGPAFGKIVPDAGAADPADWPTLRHDPARSGSTAAAVGTELAPAWKTPLPGPLTAVTVADGRLFVARREAGEVRCLDAENGKPLWSFPAGSRVDSPPAVCGNAVYFGSADGWIYCLRAADGELAWRYRVAPEARQVVAYGRLESAWPVHGTVLVRPGPQQGKPLAYAAAGRSSYVDGGVFLCAVDAATGEPRFRRRLCSLDPETGQEPQKNVRGVSMPGHIPDVLASEGDALFMRHARFDLAGRPLKEYVDHLFCSAGFVDDTWWHRTYLQIGRYMRGGYGGWGRAGNENVSGKALVRRGGKAFGFGRKKYIVTGSHIGMQAECHLFAADLNPPADKASAAKGRKGRKRRGRKPRHAYTWSKQIPFYPRGMVLAGDVLLLAGPERVEDFHAAQPGGKVHLWAVNPDTGEPLSKATLDAPPVYDSLAAAAGRLYLTTTAGQVVCLR